jgi:hypothetical protein
MKSHVWLDHGFRGDTIEIIVRDMSRTKLESWTIGVNDKKRARQVMKILKGSYGIDFGIKLDEDLGWLGNK